MANGLVGLIEEYLPKDYKACEIFGRGLTEGWSTWGDEAMKWNWDGHYAPVNSVYAGNELDADVDVDTHMED